MYVGINNQIHHTYRRLNIFRLQEMDLNLLPDPHPLFF